LTRGFVRKTSGILHAVLDCIMWQSIVVTERIGTGSLVHRCTTDIDTLDAAFTESFRACVIVGASKSSRRPASRSPPLVDDGISF
jgi:hypothetical protein